MITALLRYLLGGTPAPPPLGRALWATLGVLAFGALNLALQAELWPHTPTAGPVWQMTTGLAGLLALPQLLWWAWRWLQDYAGPTWLRQLLTLGLLGVAVPTMLLWIIGMGFWLGALLG